jgi:CRP-like cAMP-binding protein
MTEDELAEFRAMLTQHREDHAGCHVHCDGFGCHEVIRLMETLSAALQRAEAAEALNSTLSAELLRCRTTEQAAAHALDNIRVELGIDAEHVSPQAASRAIVEKYRAGTRAERYRKALEHYAHEYDWKDSYVARKALADDAALAAAGEGGGT